MAVVGSQAEYARHRSVSKKTITIWKQQGRLVLADGLVDFDASDKALADCGRPHQAGVTSEPLPEPTKVTTLASLQEKAETEVYDRGNAPHSQTEAERIKENYLALLRQLEYDTKSAAVIPVQDNVRLWTAACARLRTRLLAIPAEQAPMLHRLKTVAEVQDALLAIITEALEELSRDGLGPAPPAQ
jgi:hypothetical protein